MSALRPWPQTQAGWNKAGNATLVSRTIPWPQTQVGWNHEINPPAPPKMPHNGLQTQEYGMPETSDRGVIEGVAVVDQHFFFAFARLVEISAQNLFAPLGVDQHFFFVNVQQQLEELRQEAMEAYQANNEIDPIPDSAYEETLSLLKQMPRNVPMPDIMWSEDGGIGLEWRPENGIVTMSLYGDNHVIYGAFFGDKREVEGICTLSDTALLQGFLTTLRNFYE